MGYSFRWMEGNVLFNDSQHILFSYMATWATLSDGMFYLTTQSTHFI